MKLFSEDTLSHYGIQGQKKGIRRWQYPDGRFNEEGKIRYFGYPKRNKKINDISSIIKGYSTDDIDYDKYLKYTAYAAVALGLAYVGYRYGEDILRYSQEKTDPETGLKLLNKKETIEESMKNVNPANITDLTGGHQMNCMLCTTAYDLRQRGYDVQAGYSLKGFNEDQLFKKIYKNISVDDITLVKNSSSVKEFKDNLIDSFNKYPNGSRGNFMTSLDFGKYGHGYHSIAWEKTEKGLRFIDAQVNKEYSIDKLVDLIGNTKNSGFIRHIRTDDKIIDFKNLKKFEYIETSPMNYLRRILDIPSYTKEMRSVYNFNSDSKYGVESTELLDYVMKLDK